MPDDDIFTIHLRHIKDLKPVPNRLKLIQVIKAIPNVAKKEKVSGRTINTRTGSRVKKV